MSEEVCRHCGGIDPVIRRRASRSRADHNRLFAIIDAAYLQWPEGEFQARDKAQFRAYITVRAGHINVRSVRVPEDYAENATSRENYRMVVESTAKACSDEAGYYDTRCTATGIEIITARSIKESVVVGQKAFNDVRDAILQVIENELKVPSEQLLREKAA